MPTSSNPPVIPPQQKRFAWQIAGVVLLPLVVFPLRFGGLQVFEVFAFLALYGVVALIMLYLALVWLRRDVDSIRAMPRGGKGGASVILRIGLLAGGIGSVLLALPSWPDDDVSASEMQQVRGEIPAELHEIRRVRRSVSVDKYLKIGDVLLSCGYLWDDDCRAIRRHTGRVAEIAYHPHWGNNVVYEVRIGGRVLQSHHDAVEHFRAGRKRELEMGVAILLLVTLPYLWLWQKARRLMRLVPV